MQEQPTDDTWKIIESEYVIRRPWLTARRDHLLLPNGVEIPEYYVLEYPTWVNIIAITCDHKMVMIRQHRHGLGVTKYELCAGTMEPEKDASPLAAAQRELQEETGYGAGHWQSYMTLSANPTSMNNLCYIFLATDVEPVTAQHLDDTEVLTYHLLTEDEVFSLLQRGEIVQALMAAPLWRYFAERGFMK